MNIEIITTYYKEEFLAPLFLLHYEPWADLVTMITARFPQDQMDDAIKRDLINAAIARSAADWVIVVDMDEFVFPRPLGADPREVLAQECGDICQCEMLRVWRHATDGDVDRLKPPLPQRRHGQKDHVKPCIFRPRGVTIDIGTHEAHYPATFQWGKKWGAVHWANADPEFGITRAVVHRQTRLSPNNLKHGFGVIREWLDPKFLTNLYLQHLDDPVVVDL